MYISRLRNCFRFITPRSIVFRLLLLAQFSAVAQASERTRYFAYEISWLTPARHITWPVGRGERANEYH